MQSRGALRKELTAHLRTGRVIRRPQGARLPDGRGGRPGILNISERPAEADDRAVPGHWEGDLVFGKHMSPVATLVERSTRFVMLVALPDGHHKADLVADALAGEDHHPARGVDQDADLGPGPRDGRTRPVHRTPPGSRSTSATPSRPGSAAATRTPTACCASTYPDRLDFRTLTQADFDAIADQLNGRPRQTLGFKTPSQALAEVLR